MLRPGDEHLLRLNLGAWVRIRGAGTYRIRVWVSLDGLTVFPGQISKGVAVCPWTSIDVTATD